METDRLFGFRAAAGPAESRESSVISRNDDCSPYANRPPVTNRTAGVGEYAAIAVPAPPADFAVVGAEKGLARGEVSERPHGTAVTA